MKCRRCGEEVEDFDNHPVDCKPTPSSSRPPLPQSSSGSASDKARSVSSVQTTDRRDAITFAMESMKNAENKMEQRIKDRKAAGKELIDYLLTPGNKDATIKALKDQITNAKEAETAAGKRYDDERQFVQKLVAKKQEQVCVQDI